MNEFIDANKVIKGIIEEWKDILTDSQKDAVLNSNINDVLTSVIEQCNIDLEEVMLDYFGE